MSITYWQPGHTRSWMNLPKSKPYPQTPLAIEQAYPAPGQASPAQDASHSTPARPSSAGNRDTARTSGS